MSDEPPEPPFASPPPATPRTEARPPVKASTLVLCLLGPVPVGMIVGLMAARGPTASGHDLAVGELFGSLVAIIPGAAWSLGLLLASRFYRGEVTRVFAGLLFGLAIFLGTAAVLFAGCMCVEQGRR